MSMSTLVEHLSIEDRKQIKLFRCFLVLSGNFCWQHREGFKHLPSFFSDSFISLQTASSRWTSIHMYTNYVHMVTRIPLTLAITSVLIHSLIWFTVTTRYEHFGEVVDRVDMRGEVALLTRNVVIEGQDNSGSRFGGQMKVTNRFLW